MARSQAAAVTPKSAAFVGEFDANTQCSASAGSATVQSGSHFEANWVKQMTSDSNAVGNALRLPAVIRMTGLGRSTIYRMEAARQFPQRVKLGLRAVGWMESEVREWLAMRAGAR